jgi:hypothetical protein
MESAMGVYRRSWAGLLLLVGLAGCNRTPAPPAGTGAKEAARGYYEALAGRDWQQAYAALHPDSRKHCTQDQFTRLAQAYRRNLGFEPEAVHVQSCDEQGTEAIAHVVLTGRDSSQTRRYKDGVTLRQTVEGWRVVLPPNFGGRSG